MSTTDLIGYCAALNAAATTGLLAQLIDGPARTPGEHAAKLSLDPRATGLVVDVLVAYGLAERAGQQVAPTEALRELSRAPGGTERTIAMWAHVPEFLRTGRPFIAMDAAREQAYSGVVAVLGRM